VKGLQGAGGPPRVRNLLDVDDLSPDELRSIVELGRRSPGADGRWPGVASGKTAALVFEKASARTRSSSEVAWAQLGGHPVTIRGEEVGIDERESAEDVAITLGCYHRVIGARVRRHETLERFVAALGAKGIAVPVVNLLSDLAHPVQALADLLTLTEELGPLDRAERPVVAWVGDGNNVCRSLVLAVAMSGGRVRVGCPPGYGLEEATLARARSLGGEVEVAETPEEAVAGAAAVYTDVWTSMGQEGERSERLERFAGWRVDGRLMALARPGAIFLHCLPAHRGEEVAAEVLDGPASRVWPQAAHRLDAMRALWWWLLDPGSGSGSEG
jgi:ornithine carbamoyltransferase